MTNRCPFGGANTGSRSLDLIKPETYGTGQIHSIWTHMREHSPVYWQENKEGEGFWSVFKYKEVLQVLKNHDQFTSERGTLLNILGVEDPSGGKQMAVTDPPNHTLLRRPIQKQLTGGNIRKHREDIRAEIKRILRPLSEGETIDFAWAMAGLSVAAAGKVMGLPAEDWPMLGKLTIAAIAPDDPEYVQEGNAHKTMERAHRGLFAYFHDLIEQRKRDPQDDVISLLLNIKVDGHPLDQGAIVANCYSLLLGATVTTPHVPTSSLLELARDNGYADWAAHREELLDTGIEEALRWSSPASHFLRYAKQDVVLGGQPIKAGQAVAAWIGSANRDEDIFEHPFQFNIRRRPNRHIAFGAGPHYCVGHEVARQTIRILFEELFTTLKAVKIIGEPVYLNSNFIHGMKHLYVRGVPL